MALYLVRHYIRSIHGLYVATTLREFLFTASRTVNPLAYTGLGGVQDTLTLAIRSATGTGTAYGSFTWIEEY